MLGALAWCFLVAETAERLHLSREMGALIAGVSLSTFPYALDVTAKVTTLRDFFITLFFVALGMTIPVPNLSVIGLALMIAAFTVVSRVITTFLPLYLMKQGLRASLLPAINLAQISEFSLVVIQTGVTANHIAPQTAQRGVVRLRGARRALHLLHGAQRRDHAMGDRPAEADRPTRSRSRSGTWRGGGTRADMARRAGSSSLGFFRAASALLAEIERQNPLLLEQITVVDFNPNVVPDPACAWPARDLRRHQQCRHAASCWRRQVRDDHPQRAGPRC